MSNKSVWSYLALAFNIVNHSLILATSAYLLIVVWRVPYVSLQWHIGLSGLGYQLLMAQAILSFSANNFWSMGLSRKGKATAHLVLQILGSFFAIAGCTVELVYQQWSFNWDSYHTVFGEFLKFAPVNEVTSNVRIILNRFTGNPFPDYQLYSWSLYLLRYQL